MTGSEEPLALSDRYRPRVVDAGSNVMHLSRRADRRPGEPHATYQLTCWHAPGVLVGSPGNLERQTAAEGVWLTPPGERLSLNAPKGAEVGWIHCRLVTSPAWDAKGGRDFRLSSMGNDALIQPQPGVIWGVDLCHAPPSPVMTWASRTCFRLIAAWNEIGPAGRIEADGELALLFHRWFSEARRDDPGGTHTNAISVDDTAVLRRCNRILADVERMDLTVDALADEVGVKRDVLNRIYRGHRGQSLGWRLRERRLRRALKLLADRSTTVDEVARKCGYANAAVLRRALKKRFGRRPRDFRR